jgi:hypothetical protein
LYTFLNNSLRFRSKGPVPVPKFTSTRKKVFEMLFNKHSLVPFLVATLLFLLPLSSCFPPGTSLSADSVNGVEKIPAVPLFKVRKPGKSIKTPHTIHFTGIGVKWIMLIKMPYIFKLNK